MINLIKIFFILLFDLEGKKPEPYKELSPVNRDRATLKAAINRFETRKRILTVKQAN